MFDVFKKLKVRKERQKSQAFSLNACSLECEKLWTSAWYGRAGKNRKWDMNNFSRHRLLPWNKEICSLPRLAWDKGLMEPTKGEKKLEEFLDPIRIGKGHRMLGMRNQNVKQIPSPTLNIMQMVIYIYILVLVLIMWYNV